MAATSVKTTSGETTHVDIQKLVSLVVDQIQPKRSQFWEAADRILKILVVVIAPIGAWLVVFFINTVLDGIQNVADLTEDHEKRILVIENTRYTLKDAAAIQETITRMLMDINERARIADIPPAWFKERVEDLRQRVKALEQATGGKAGG